MKSDDVTPAKRRSSSGGKKRSGKANRPAPDELRAETVVAAPPPASVPPVSTPLTVTPAAPGKQPPEPEFSVQQPDFEQMSRNTARLMEEGGKVLAAYMKPFETGRMEPGLAEQAAAAVKVMGEVAEHWLADPAKAMEAQTNLSARFLSLWGSTLRRLSGENVAPVVPPDPADKRFADPQWQASPLFDFLRQAHSLTSTWASDLVTNVEGLDPLTRQKALFYLRQISSALSPSNFVVTNPELLRETFSENGDNLVRGLRMLAEDLEAGKGQLRIRQSDSSKFELGVNMAATPGKVVFRNDLIELIQYAPTTETVFARPLVMIPPWINKFYILDLNPEKSMVRWLVAQGFTVFMVSWVNPDERLATKTFEDYMREGIMAAVGAAKAVTGEPSVAAVGYCVGGTLLAATLAYMAKTGNHSIDSATFFATLVDFTDPGELKLFIDRERLNALETQMADTGYLDGSAMANAFNMLRPNELIWNYVVNNYLKGKEPPAFDLLTWNSDSTRMPAANHAFYLRNCYVENNLINRRMIIAGTPLDLGAIDLPSFFVATREDHIAPAGSVYSGARYFGGDVTYVLAGSGHIAGIVNPPQRPKYQFWTDGDPGAAYDAWTSSAKMHPGSWWPRWVEWLTQQNTTQVPARVPGEGPLPALCDAPGTYVRVKS